MIAIEVGKSWNYCRRDSDERSIAIRKSTGGGDYGGITTEGVSNF